jgi:hypothetical protein
MVIPEAREKDFQRKMKSPLFSEHFEKDNWTLLFFDAFRQAFAKTRAGTELEPLLGAHKSSPTVYRLEGTNETQRLMEFGGTEALAARHHAIEEAADTK